MNSLIWSIANSPLTIDYGLSTMEYGLSTNDYRPWTIVKARKIQKVICVKEAKTLLLHRRLYCRQQNTLLTYMSKLAKEDKFLDLSDYGRTSATYFVNIFKDTRLNAVHITLMFGVSGLLAIYCILKSHFYFAAIFLVLKSVLDAADGEMSRAKNQPSYTGRYLDSIFDIILNFLILGTIASMTNQSCYLASISFICFQLQGTLYNYYYVILRNKSHGADATSKVFEYRRPKALESDNQMVVNILFTLFMVFYSVFDKIIYTLDSNAYKSPAFPHWFMSFVSIYGLGFQLLIIALLLVLGLIHFIIPFFIGYSVFILVLVVVRKRYL